MEQSDKELSILAGKGDETACGQLFERYQNPIYNFVYRLVNNAEDASDITQDAFIKIYGVLGRRQVDNFSAYLYQTARNLAYDEMRRRSRFADVDHDVLVPEDPGIYADPQRALLLGEQMDMVRQAVGRLGDNQRAALILRELQELDYNEMAEILESNRNAVGALLSRARLRLREELRMAQVQTEQCPPECEDIIALLSPYIDGELKAAEKEKVAAHLEDCTFCTAALEDMREASRSFRILIPVLPPADMAQAFAGKLEEAAARNAASAGKNSFAERVLRRKTAWIAGFILVLLVTSATLLAEQSSNDTEFVAGAAVTTATMTAAPGGADGSSFAAPSESAPAAVSNSSNSSTQAAEVSAESAAPGIGNTAAGNGISADQPASPAGNPIAPYSPPAPRSLPSISVLSGSASPNPAVALSNITFTATIAGGASSVSLTLVNTSRGSSQTVISLSRIAGSGGQETWQATRYMGSSSSGNCSMYVNANSPQGQSASSYVGSLTILDRVY